MKVSMKSSNLWGGGIYSWSHNKQTYTLYLIKQRVNIFYFDKNLKREVPVIKPYFNSLFIKGYQNIDCKEYR